MRAGLFAVIAGVSAACGPAAAQDAGDEAQVRGLMEALSYAWNAGDAAGWAALFDTDAEMVAPRGLRIVGRDAIEDGHEGVFATIYEDTTLDITVDHVRFLTGDIAMVAFHQMIQTAPGTSPQGSAGQDLISTLIARRDSHEDVWLVEYLDTIPAAPADFTLPTADNPSPNGE